MTDYLRARYKSKAVVWISSICLVLFFVAQMMSQFIGGAVLFQSITGLPYIYGLVLFGAVVIIYTTIGGFKAVTTTDTIQGIIMVIGGFIILATIVTTAGGFDSPDRKAQRGKSGLGGYHQRRFHGKGLRHVLLGSGRRRRTGSSADGGAWHGLQKIPKRCITPSSTGPSWSDS